MIKSTYYYWKDILDKTIPAKAQGSIFIVALVLIIIHCCPVKLFKMGQAYYNLTRNVYF